MTRSPDIKDVVERLRTVVPYQGRSNIAFMCHEAADIIDALLTDRASMEHQLKGYQHHLRGCEQIAGKALGYPWFKDDPANFPEATEADGVCVGEHVGETIVEELATKLASMEGEIAGLKEELEAARKPKRDAMIDRSEEDWEALEDAIGTLWGLEPGHVLTEVDVAGLRHMDTCHRNDEELATDAYHRGHEDGLRKRGGDELVQMSARADTAMIERGAEKALRAFAEHRADAAESEAATYKAEAATGFEALKEKTRLANQLCIAASTYQDRAAERLERIEELEAERDHASTLLQEYVAQQNDCVRGLQARIKALEEALRKVNVILTVPAAEYVPAITEAWAIIEAALTQQSEETDHA